MDKIGIRGTPSERFGTDATLKRMCCSLPSLILESRTNWCQFVYGSLSLTNPLFFFCISMASVIDEFGTTTFRYTQFVIEIKTIIIVKNAAADEEGIMNVWEWNKKDQVWHMWASWLTPVRQSLDWLKCVSAVHCSQIIWWGCRSTDDSWAWHNEKWKPQQSLEPNLTQSLITDRTDCSAGNETSQ